MQIRISKLALLMCLAIPCMSLSMAFSEPPTREEKIKAIAQSANQPHDFYGKVVDMDSNPLEGVEVEVNFTSVSEYGAIENKSLKISTGKNGEFKVEFVGFQVRVKSLKKELYELSRVNEVFGVDYDVPKPFQTSKAKPLVFRLRKRLVPAYLIYQILDNTRISFIWDKEKVGGFELLWQSEWADENGVMRKSTKNRRHASFPKKYHKDLIAKGIIQDPFMLNEVFMEGKPIEDNGDYEITFKVREEGAGVIVSDELLYEAPADGYKPAASLAIHNVIPKKSPHSVKYLYVKGPEGKYYSRVNIEVRLNKESVDLSFARYTNPTSSRNLEYDSEYQRQERSRRYGIARKRREVMEEIKNKRWAEIRECKKQKIKFDEKKFNEENKFDEEKFMEKIRAEEAEAKKNKPLKWWDKLKKEKEDMGK